MNYFYPIKTEDGTISLFNTIVNDVYHSKIGAYTEALEKFVIPSGILEFIKNNNNVNILDMCFGLGYNSKAAVSEIWKINPNCKINITGLEYDPNVLAFSTLESPNYVDSKVNEIFNTTISSVIDIEAFANDYKYDVNFTRPDLGPDFSGGSNSICMGLKNNSLHNIYYRSISNRNNRVKIAEYKSDLLNITIFICDARQVIKDLNHCYDYIFHDPFTPSKLPTLWTVDIFKEYYRLLKEDGNITTYSAAAPVRAGLIDAGFYIGKTDPIGRKESGTIAAKKNELIKIKLSDKEEGLINTNAGIPYRDPNFQYNTEQILNNREESQKISGRISTSKYLKNFSNGNIS
ncbi:MAG: hypothetical protein A2287_10695 [Candidatus Melainabacteria bacterium RIFOXYA12_FULL_32_12]|nr:MAG: hypothetical protein A2255_01695 [Candidatus Melainabacteria bacterium RIFOXYA2_FULL_32_9]OGI24272.1 MAG: hypothetical protein A2287_10695 [Candidatus Melainabacteria bacterium RIFOXYA12_FULL_32_12]